MKTYKLAVKEVSSAKMASEVKDAVFKLIDLINTLPNIETTEREDVRSAIQQLVKECPVDISEEQAEEWFDEIRHF